MLLYRFVCSFLYGLMRLWLKLYELKKLWFDSPEDKAVTAFVTLLGLGATSVCYPAFGETLFAWSGDVVTASLAPLRTPGILVVLTLGMSVTLYFTFNTSHN